LKRPAAFVLGGVVIAVVLVAVLGGKEGDLVAQAESPDADERLKAVNGLADIGSDGAADALIRACADPDERVAVRAIAAVKRRGRRKDVPHLRRAVRDDRPKVRASAVTALGQFPLRNDVDANLLISRLNDPYEYPEVRGAAARSLGRMHIWGAMAHLVDALEDSDAYVRGQAGAAVRRILGRDYGFRANASSGRRREVIARIRAQWPTFHAGHLRYMRRLKEKRK